jgi:hypothetical protein
MHQVPSIPDPPPFVQIMRNLGFEPDPWQVAASGLCSGHPAAKRAKKAKNLSAPLAHGTGPALCGRGLPLGGVVAGVADVDGEIGEELQAALQGAKVGMMRQEQLLQRDEIMGLGHGVAQFLQERLEELLGGLLAMETAFIVKRLAAATELQGGGVIAFRLANPPPRRSFHRGPYPWW